MSDIVVAVKAHEDVLATRQKMYWQSEKLLAWGSATEGGYRGVDRKGGGGGVRRNLAGGELGDQVLSHGPCQEPLI